MSVLIPDELSTDSLEELSQYYGDTQITYNGQYYDHTRKIYLTKDGGDYVLVPAPSKDKKSAKAIVGVHHYMVDSNYKFIQSFVTINNSFICTLPEKALLTMFLARSFCFFRSLPPNIRATLKENGRNVFVDYTQMKLIG